MTNRVVEPGITLDIALLVKSKMTAIVQRQTRSNNKFISFSTEWKHIHDFIKCIV